jgi:ERCC4-type nuclease
LTELAYEVVVDSREQSPWWVDNVVRKKLDTGDYSIVGFEDCFALERKSMADFAQTLTKGHKRFQQELARATELRYFAIIIEEPYNALLQKKWRGSAFTRVSGAALCAIANTLRVKYGFHIIFCSNRTEAKSVAKGLMSSFVRLQECKKNGETEV